MNTPTNTNGIIATAANKAAPATTPVATINAQIPIFEEVTRKKSKARIALVGPSGAGKTLSALLMAYGITGDWKKVALIDTEHERGRFYAERTDFDIGKFLYAPLYPPYSPEKYISYVNSAVQAVGNDGVVIVDSFSHAWDNEGGVLDIKSQIAKRQGKNDYTAWDEAGKIQNGLINSILSIPCHAIVTMRTKMAYAMEINDRGKTVPVKIGLAPVQRENAEYEFDVVLQINRDHIASASKDTTFLDTWNGVITADLGKQLAAWLDQGEEPVRCADCGYIIKPTSKYSVLEIAEKTTEKFGRVLCGTCSKTAKPINNNPEPPKPAPVPENTESTPSPEHPLAPDDYPFKE